MGSNRNGQLLKEKECFVSGGTQNDSCVSTAWRRIKDQNISLGAQWNRFYAKGWVISRDMI
jgi:hypothetical protein